ncbi:tyrosine-type recombinase/integrase [Saccharothrix algeriensis]|uniref:DMT family permease n=2 Tax=Catellatospora bangladeshensis TaxID=310355 RepID=A0A8J3JMK6_9ACTN|nr:DMT family permease [Catellatospora bangladeshensis]
MAWMENTGRSFRVRRRYRGRTVTDSTYPTEAEANARLAQLAAVRRGIRRYLADVPAPTLRQWVNMWLPSHTAGPVTLARYESMLRVHILPRFGDRHLDEISRNDVKAFALDLRARLAPVSVRSVVTLLGLVLREAIEEHYLYFDPTGRLRLRDGITVPRPVATPEQVWQIACRMPDLITRTLVMTAAYTGARIGELLGLDRRNVHLDTGVVDVVPKVGALHEEGGDRWLGDPKTAASVRQIALPPFLVEGLGILLAAHPHGTVFCIGDGDWMWRTTYVQRYWRPACDGRADRGWAPILAGLRFHDLRHAHRTWMDEDRIPEVLKNQRLGHAMPGIAGVYSHVTDAMQPALLESLQRRWQDNGARWWTPEEVPIMKGKRSPVQSPTGRRPRNLGGHRRPVTAM